MSFPTLLSRKIKNLATAKNEPIFIKIVNQPQVSQRKAAFKRSVLTYSSAASHCCGEELWRRALFPRIARNGWFLHQVRGATDACFSQWKTNQFHVLWQSNELTKMGNAHRSSTCMKQWQLRSRSTRAAKHWQVPWLMMCFTFYRNAQDERARQVRTQPRNRLFRHLYCSVVWDISCWDVINV